MNSAGVGGEMSDVYYSVGTVGKHGVNCSVVVSDGSAVADCVSLGYGSFV